MSRSIHAAQGDSLPFNHHLQQFLTFLKQERGFADATIIWSFLMASAHGAGLMLIPVLWSRPTVAMHHAMSGPMTFGSMETSGAPLTASIALISVLVHTAAMLAVAGFLALAFFELYEKVGLQILRHTWLNFDLLWAVALLIAAVALLFGG